MADRGRHRKDEATRKSAPLGVRVSPILKQQLEDAAKESGRSLSQEIETRLRLSLGEQQRRVDEFGGSFNYSLFHTICDRIRSMELSVDGKIEGEPSSRWWKNRYTFDECVDFISALIAMYRPKQRKVVPQHLKGYPLGKRTAVIAMANLKMAIDGFDLIPKLTAASVPMVTKLTTAAVPKRSVK
jgi:hypothetical protein